MAFAEGGANGGAFVLLMAVLLWLLRGMIFFDFVPAYGLF